MGYQQDSFYPGTWVWVMTIMNLAKLFGDLRDEKGSLSLFL